MSEQEEFEFRLRLESEQASAVKPRQSLEQSAAEFAAGRQQRTADQIGGLIRGAGSIGATLLTPIDAAARALGVQNAFIGRTDRREAMDQALTDLMGADTESSRFKALKTGAEVAGTMGVGGALAKGAAMLPGAAKAAPVIDAIGSSGFTAGGATGARALAARTAGGAITGGVSAGLVDPSQAGMGAAIGGALPVGSKVVGATGNAIGQGFRAAGRAIVGDVSPEVVALAKRAEDLGIKIPADRLVDSKALNAASASLGYMPFSGRAATEDAMLSSMNRALSRTFGQDSDNVTMALRKASSALGSKFDDVLKNNAVQMTPSFRQALAAAEDQATSELGPEAASIIQKQIAQIQTKGASGAIDGQTAYNIKKALDRIGSGSSDAAFYARDLKKKLMDALNESLGPAQAKAFADVRKQYGNMLALENLAQNGAEGGVSVGRLANLKNINNPDLQELADIAAQFLRTRESPHGAMQRLVIGGVGATAAGGMGMLPMLPVVAAAGRGANMLMNSSGVRNAVLGTPTPPNALQALLATPEFGQLAYRVAPPAWSGQ